MHFSGIHVTLTPWSRRVLERSSSRHCCSSRTMSTRVLWSTPTALVRLIPTYIHCQKCKTRFLIAFLKLFRSLYNCVKQFLAILKYHRNLSDMWIQKQSNVKQIPAFLRFSKCGLSIRLSDSQDLLDQTPVPKKVM